MNEAEERWREHKGWYNEDVDSQKLIAGQLRAIADVLDPPVWRLSDVATIVLTVLSWDEHVIHRQGCALEAGTKFEWRPLPISERVAGVIIDRIT